MMEVAAVSWVWNSFRVPLDSKKELSLYLPESYYLQKMLIVVENTDEDLDRVQLWCVCVLVDACTPMCVGGSWRERGKL